MFEMSQRLKAIVNMAPSVKTAADIGCDHGKAGAALLLAGKAQHMIFSDISGKSLEKTRRLVYDEGLEQIASLRVGDGLHVLRAGEAQAAVIAGMGGELIAGMLGEGKEKAPGTLVLSCNTKPEVLRRWLCSNGYAIKDEELVFEDERFYPVILALKGMSRNLTDIELELGPVLLLKRPETLMRLVNLKIQTAIENRGKIERFGTPKAKEKLGELDGRIERLKEVRRCLQQQTIL